MAIVKPRHRVVVKARRAQRRDAVALARTEEQVSRPVPRTVTSSRKSAWLRVAVLQAPRIQVQGSSHRQRSPPELGCDSRMGSDRLPRSSIICSMSSLPAQPPPPLQPLPQGPTVASECCFSLLQAGQQGRSKWSAGPSVSVPGNAHSTHVSALRAFRTGAMSLASSSCLHHHSMSSTTPPAPHQYQLQTSTANRQWHATIAHNHMLLVFHR
jgi:hypothetical protein